MSEFFPDDDPREQDRRQYESNASMIADTAKLMLDSFSQTRIGHDGKLIDTLDWHEEELGMSFILMRNHTVEVESEDQETEITFDVFESYADGDATCKRYFLTPGVKSLRFIYLKMSEIERQHLQASEQSKGITEDGTMVIGPPAGSVSPVLQSAMLLNSVTKQLEVLNGE